MAEQPKELARTETDVRAGAQLPHDLAVIKMENESRMSLAAARPRDYGQVLANVKAQLAAYKSFAQEAIYNKPVGKDRDTGKMKFARGLSIRAAEALAEAYRYCKVRSDVTPLDDDTVRVEACFTDYQTGRVWQDSGIVSKSYKMRNGKIARHSDDRFYNVVVKAEASRRIRECIMRMIPPGLRSELVLCVDEQLDAFLDESTVDKIVAEFSKRGVTLEMIERLLAKRRASFTKEDRANLVGVWNAIKDGETTVAEAFGDNGGPDATDAEIEAGLRKKPEPPPAPANETITKGPPPPIAPTVSEPPSTPPAPESPTQPAPTAPVASEEPIGQASDLYRNIWAAYDKLDTRQRTEVRKQLGIKLIPEIAKWGELDANDGLVAINAKRTESQTAT